MSHGQTWDETNSSHNDKVGSETGTDTYALTPVELTPKWLTVLPLSRICFESIL